MSKSWAGKYQVPKTVTSSQHPGRRADRESGDPAITQALLSPGHTSLSHQSHTPVTSVMLMSDGPWSPEHIYQEIVGYGKSRQRGEGSEHLIFLI